MNTLSDRLAVITGGTSGIGFAAATELGAQGARLIITGTKKETLQKEANELAAVGVALDQRTLSDLDRLVQVIKENGP